MTDWSRVARAVYRVRQHYRYTYSGPVWDMKQRLVSVGRYALRGVSHPQELFTFDPDA